MISQADLIKTLINKNCTDESVMSTALSPACNPPKLLEKLTEAERFDLALDVSMKLGLDVTPLWRTWAMRCLQNRNFLGAREKFRHCFLRLRLPGNRISPIQSKLLTDITHELVKMSETQWSLSDEVEFIKHNKLNFHQLEKETSDTQKVELVTMKPKIYSECLYYLNQYGTIEDSIRFYIENSIWDESIRIFLDEKSIGRIDLEKFFIPEVVLYSASRGDLKSLIDSFKRVDSKIIVSLRYFEAIYNFCKRNNRYNTLYYVQYSIGDYLAAARTQIDFFFFRTPIKSYRDYNQRLSNLYNALENLKKFQDKVNIEKSNDDEMKIENENETNKTKGNPMSRLFSLATNDEILKQIELLNLQITITKNFALNEVTGCINGIDSGIFTDNNNENSKKQEVREDLEDDSIPVTLFDKSERRKTFLAALVLIYYDLTCSACFSKNGLDLANRIIIDHGLDKLKAFKNAMRIIIEDESCDIIDNATLLMDRIKEDYMDNLRLKAESSLDKVKRTTKQATATSTAKVSSDQRLIVASRRSTGNQAKLKLSINEKNAATQSARTGDPASPSSHSGAVHAKSPTATAAPPQQPTPLNTYQALVNSKKNGKQQSASDVIRSICDEVIRDAIGSCREADYRMELAKLLSAEAKIELYIEHGKLSDAQRLACTMNRPDYVLNIIEEASKLNQNHIKTVCQLWLAKHETRNLIR